MKRLIVFSLLLLALGIGIHSSEANAQSNRHRIGMCWQAGAINPQLMQLCSGLHVDIPTFVSCMQGGPCLGEPPIGAAGPPRLPPG